MSKTKSKNNKKHRHEQKKQKGEAPNKKERSKKSSSFFSSSFTQQLPPPKNEPEGGGKKRKISSSSRRRRKIEFVYPKAETNGIQKVFLFDSASTTNNNSANNKEDFGKKQKQITNIRESIEEIFEKKKKLKLKKDKHRNENEDDEEEIIRKANTNNQQEETTTTTTTEEQAKEIDRSKRQKLKQQNTKTTTTTTTANKGGHLSGVSIEDVVRDKSGCRPRANSTDGELNLPRRGLCDERMVLEVYKWKAILCRPKDAAPSGKKSHHQQNNTLLRGFVNLGNTCFLNSTLQCLAYLPPFCQCLMAMPSYDADMDNKALKNGKKKISQGKRITLMIRNLFHKVHNSNHADNPQTGPIQPTAIVKALPTVGLCGSRNGYKFRPGRQEDAHEFLVYLLDAMNDGELKEAGINQHISGWRDKLPIPRLDETTFIHRIFGGYLRSQVQCNLCGYQSNTYDPFLDLALEISKKSCTSITTAISEFTRIEILDSENRWKCSGCSKRVRATKQLTVFRPPLSLCIQLKRFSFGHGTMLSSYNSYSRRKGFGGGIQRPAGGGKITKPMEFPAEMKLPLSDGRSCEYTLTGIVIHVGGSASSGHYTAYVKKPVAASSGESGGGGSTGSSNNNATGKPSVGSTQWYHLDDSFVEPVNEKTVLKQRDAYLLFYCRKEVKLEFPSPPTRNLSSSMSTEQAKELNRERAKVRSGSFSCDDTNPTANNSNTNTISNIVSITSNQNQSEKVATVQSTKNGSDNSNIVTVGDRRASDAEKLKETIASPKVAEDYKKKVATGHTADKLKETKADRKVVEDHNKKGATTAAKVPLDKNNNEDDNHTILSTVDGNNNNNIKHVSSSTTTLSACSEDSNNINCLSFSDRDVQSVLKKQANSAGDGRRGAQPSIKERYSSDVGKLNKLFAPDDNNQSTNTNEKINNKQSSMDDEEKNKITATTSTSNETETSKVTTSAKKNKMNQQEQHKSEGKRKLQLEEKSKAASASSAGKNCSNASSDSSSSSSSSSDESSSSPSSDEPEEKKRKMKVQPEAGPSSANVASSTSQDLSAADKHTKDDSINDRKNRNNKQKKRIVIEGTGSSRTNKVSVIMGPRHKGKSWKPKALSISKKGVPDCELLGNQPVEKWDDDDNGGNDKDNNENRSKKAEKSTSSSSARSKLVNQMEKDATSKKRKMRLDRWDSVLDEGKTKKTKKKHQDVATTSSSNPHSNVFQRIQSGVQRMNRGQTKGWFRNNKEGSNNLGNKYGRK